MKKIGIFFILCLLLSCKRINVEPASYNEGKLLKKVVFSEGNGILTTVDFSYSQDGLVESAHKVIKSNFAKDSLLDYSYLYDNSRLRLISLQVNNANKQNPIQSDQYYKEENFNYNIKGYIGDYEIMEMKFGENNFHSYFLGNGLAIQPDYYICQQDRDSIDLDYPSPNSYNVNYFQRTSVDTYKYEEENMTIDQNIIYYSDLIHYNSYTVNYSTLVNPFQKEVWETFGWTFGSRFMSIASGDTLFHYLPLNFIQNMALDGGTISFEYNVDAEGNIKKIDMYSHSAFSQTNEKYLVRHYDLYY